MKHHEIPASHFNKKTLKALTKKGITIIGSFWGRAPGGDHINGQTIYDLNDNGTGKAMTYLQILEVAK